MRVQQTLQNPRTTKNAFTLIELLVVMAIITILAGILVPLAPRMLGQAKKTKAKGDAVSVRNAVTQFLAEYGYLPASGTVNTHDSALMDALTGSGSDNPRGIVFLETEQSNATSQFGDPWQRPYYVYLDDDGDGKVDVGGGTYLTSCIVHSYGADGVSGGSVGLGDDVWTVSK